MLKILTSSVVHRAGLFVRCNEIITTWSEQVLHYPSSPVYGLQSSRAASAWYVSHGTSQILNPRNIDIWGHNYCMLNRTLAFIGSVGSPRRSYKLRDLKDSGRKLDFFLKRVPNFFSSGEWKRNERKVAEEYCWTITQAAGRSRCERPGSSVLERGFQIHFLVYTS